MASGRQQVRQVFMEVADLPAAEPTQPDTDTTTQPVTPDPSARQRSSLWRYLTDLIRPGR